MNDQMRPKPALKAFFIIGGLSLVLFFMLAASCSIVFRSSIQGTVIDREAWADGTTTGVTDAKVFLYTDVAARNADYDAYADGDETSLPDGAAKAEYGYFQSTVTDADGGYDFTGFIWEKLFSEYGKTADRAEIHLLIYHPDYGLWKNPVPLYVVSDVTNQLPQITIEDLWNAGRFAGTVSDWASGVDEDPLNGVTVNLYVAETWTFDAAGAPVSADATYPGTPTGTTTTDADGRWAATFRFRKMPGRGDDVGKVPVRITYVFSDYRANQPESDATVYSPAFSNSGLITTVDLDEDGADAVDGDYEDAFLYATAEYNLTAGEAKLVTVPDVMMQRWQFSATVAGQVVDEATPPAGIDGVTVDLIAGTETFSADTAPTDTANSTESGRFDLGTITWKITDITDSAKQKTGEVDVTMSLTGATYVSGYLLSLKPDTQRSITLKAAPL